MKIARVLLTRACPRACVYCCNNYDHIMKQAVTINDLAALATYDQVLLTGGEPMLYPDEIRRIVPLLRKQNPDVVVYLYSALFTTAMLWVLPIVDGIHFTLHVPFSMADLGAFQSFQALIADYPEKSFRLYINQAIKSPITLRPERWSRIESKPWIPKNECVLPPNEELFLWERVGEL